MQALIRDAQTGTLNSSVVLVCRLKPRLLLSFLFLSIHTNMSASMFSSDASSWMDSFTLGDQTESV